MEELTTSVHTVPASVDACELVRNGNAHEHQVRCTASYLFQGKQYSAASAAWSSDSLFVTSGSLAEALASQSQIKFRPVHVYSYASERAAFVDNRLITMPSLGTMLGVLLLACICTYIASIPTVYRRSEMTADGRFLKAGRRKMLQLSALFCASAICIYALTNRPANVDRVGLSNLQQVPARLTDCTHRFHGLSRGHDEINCGFQYIVNGKSYSGHAEGMEFRMFPTNGRMDAEVTRVQQTPTRMAYVDPQHPSYALAYINNDWLFLIDGDYLKP